MAISSTVGIASEADFLTAYAASKFGVEGFMEGLATEIAPFGLQTMAVEPGFFRTELLAPQPTRYAEPSIPADVLVELASLEEPPRASPPA